MIEKVYLVCDCFEAGQAVEIMALKIPCFVTVEIPDFGYDEEVVVTVKCRECDLSYVEETLAPFV